MMTVETSPIGSIDPKSCALLIVDDEPGNLATATEYLSNCGFQVKVAQTGETGLELARLAQPDLILLDVRLPGLDGFETCHRLKADERTQDIPVIFMTVATKTACRLLIVYITSYRLLAIALTGISGWLIYKIVENTHSHLAPTALAAWLLSPLTLITTAVGGHNDAVMLVFMILSWWFLQRQKPILALLALIMGAHVKLTALIWLPTSILWIIWRWGWKRALKICLISLTIGVVISWLLYKPFGGWGTLPQMLSERAKFLANSFWRILYHQLNYRWGWTLENARQLSTRLSSLLAAAGAFIVPLWMFNFRPQRWRREETVKTNKEVILWQSLASVSMVTLLIGTFWFQHWYILWALAPAVLLPNSRLTRSTLPWLAFGALSSNVVMSFLVETLLKTSPRISKYISEVVMIWGPVFIVSIIYLLLQWRGKRKSVMPIQQP